MKDFWEGFEKRAVSKHFVERGLMHGLLQRAKNTDPKMLDLVEKHLAQHKAIPENARSWKAGLNVQANAMARKRLIDLDYRTKNKPEGARRELDNFREFLKSS